jgi:hypothetical protein
MMTDTLRFDALNTQRKIAWAVKSEEDEEITGADEETELGLDKEDEDVAGDLELNEEFDEVKENGLDQSEEDKVDDFFEVEK